MIEHKICTNCVMDTTAANITFNSQGRCNYCLDFEEKIRKYKSSKPSLTNLLNKIKNKKKKYDCIIGLSGGVDSSFAVHKAVQCGLKPLVVHMDNGWNSELAQNNIENLVKKLNLDLYTYVIDWTEYKSFMNSFFESNVIDIELLMDNAMISVNYNQASKNNLNYILAGTNLTSEGMKMPINMNWLKYDKKNIKNIIKKFGNHKFKTYPSIGTFNLIYYILIKRIRWTSFLDYFDYNKFEAEKILKENYNFKPYPYKHYESVFTRFYQGYILPKKFNIDKRILHYSTLILSESLSRNEAINELNNNSPYSSSEQLESDKQYFLKKLDWTESKLNLYLKEPRIEHSQYGSEKSLYKLMLKIYKFLN